jgi:hypothetical protein
MFGVWMRGGGRRRCEGGDLPLSNIVFCVLIINVKIVKNHSTFTYVKDRCCPRSSRSLITQHHSTIITKKKKPQTLSNLKPLQTS